MNNNELDKKISLYLCVFVAALTIIFIALDISGVISWHWGWLISPIWITIAIIGLLCFVLGI